MVHLLRIEAVLLLLHHWVRCELRIHLHLLWCLCSELVSHETTSLRHHGHASGHEVALRAVVHHHLLLHHLWIHHACLESLLVRHELLLLLWEGRRLERLLLRHLVCRLLEARLLLDLSRLCCVEILESLHLGLLLNQVCACCRGYQWGTKVHERVCRFRRCRLNRLGVE